MDKRVVIGLVGLVGAAVAVAVALVDDPVAGSASGAEELTRNVEQIRQAELTIHGLFGDYAACSSRESALAAATPTARSWVGEPCWVAVGWQPDAPVRGGYWVELTASGFVAGGLIRDGASVIEVRATEGSAAASR